MALRPEYQPAHPEYDGFLFAVIGEGESGQELTVLSALARLKLDPQDEAARLSELTMESAADELAVLISTLPEDDWQTLDCRTLDGQQSDCRSIAGRLVKYLPSHVSRSGNFPKSTSDRYHSQNRQRSIRWIWIAGAALLLAAMFMLSSNGDSEVESSGRWLHVIPIAGMV